MPSCLRMLAICSGLEILPASTIAGSPPTQLNRTKMSRITPPIVGMICNSLRITYAVISLYLPFHLLHGRALRGHVEVQVLEVRIDDRVLLVSLHPRVLQMVEDAVHAQSPRRVREDEPVHLSLELVALG